MKPVRLGREYIVNERKNNLRAIWRQEMKGFLRVENGIFQFPANSQVLWGKIKKKNYR